MPPYLIWCPGHSDFRLGGDLEGGGGLARTVFIVGEHPHTVEGARQQALQGHLLQGAPCAVHHPLPLALLLLVEHRVARHWAARVCGGLPGQGYKPMKTIFK